MRKATISFVMSGRPSVCPHGTTRLPLDGFWWNFLLSLFSKICPENSSFIKIWQEQRLLYVKTFSHLWQYIARMRNVLDKSCRVNQNTHFTFNNIFFLKARRLWDNVEKYGGARETTNKETIWRIRVSCWIRKATCMHEPAHADARGHTHACARVHTRRIICNTYCFSTATMISERA